MPYKDYEKAKQKARERYHKNPQKSTKQTMEWRKNNRKQHRQVAKERRIQIKLNVINHYGGKCACCGETAIEFLCVDHINNDGAEHRKQQRSVAYGNNFYQWIIRNSYPEDLRILCHNCNISLGLYGYCPHQIGDRRNQ